MAKKQDAFRKLIKTFPGPDEVKQILNGLDAESDRGVALIAAAFLENGLERLILANIGDKSHDLKNQMFENRGPVADFHSKILIVQAFGLLPEMFDGDLHRVKRIRNVFAHATRQVTFDLKEISDEVLHSEFLSFVRTTDLPWTELAINALEKPRAGFILIVRYLFLMIDRAVQKKGGAPLQSP